MSSLYHEIMVPVDLAHLTGLAKALRTAADLVVMASHIPDVDDRLFASNAAFVAASATVTVMVVR